MEEDRKVFLVVLIESNRKKYTNRAIHLFNECISFNYFVVYVEV